MNQDKNLLVSIIIPTYNRANLIEETLISIIDQTYFNWECLIIDDGSSDNTSKVLEKYIKQDNRIKYYLRPEKFKKGPSGCRNYGFELSKGTYINWFDSDDLMISNKLETELGYLKTSKYDFCISQTIFFDDITRNEFGYWNEKLFSDDPINDFILLRIGWSTNAPLWKKASLIKFDIKFNENIIAGDDYHFHIQALKHGLKPKVIDDIHVKNRIHPNRIENHRYKAHSKSIIVIDLIKNKDKLNLSKECINKQYVQGFYLLKNMYKQKRLSEGMEFSRKLYLLNKQIFTYRKIDNIIFKWSFL